MKKNVLGTVIFLILVCLGLMFFTSIYSSSQSLVELEITNLNLKTVVADNLLIKQVQELSKNKPFKADYRVSNRILSISGKQQHQQFYYFNSSVFSLDSNSLFLLPADLKAELTSLFSTLGEEVYGQYLPWSEAKLLFPKDKDALVTDLETGLSFNVRRRAGTHHADVQPLTAKDTEIMKGIYGDKWSWRRRAVILTIDGNRIAASMNGMPHGAGSIKNNNFPGHFCIHFLDSKVHKSNKVDLAHQLMIAKAGGKLDKEILSATPEKLIAIFFTALKEQDWNMAALTLGFNNVAEKNSFLATLQQYDEIKNFSMQKMEDEVHALLQIIPVSVTWKKKGEINYTTNTFLLNLKKPFIDGEWYICADSFSF